MPILYRQPTIKEIMPNSQVLFHLSCVHRAKIFHSPKERKKREKRFLV